MQLAISGFSEKNLREPTQETVGIGEEYLNICCFPLSTNGSACNLFACKPHSFLADLRIYLTKSISCPLPPS